MEGYCMKCKSKQEIKDPKAITMKNGRSAMEGRCPVCSTRIFRIGAAPVAQTPAPKTGKK
jgi:DNA-directed RNA polymerase subunit RPC12/RpoP